MLDPKSARQFALYGALGFEVAAAVIGGLALGYFIDKKFGWSPWAALSGLGLGSIVAFVRILELVSEVQRNETDEPTKGRDDGTKR